MTSVDLQQHVALKAREADVQAMRARAELQELAQAEIIHLPRPATVDDPPIWGHTRAVLRSSLPDIYPLWIEPLCWVGQEGNTVVLSGPDPYFCSWVKDNYLQPLESALEATGFLGGKVRLTVGNKSGK